jgi:hypothetical protein
LIPEPPMSMPRTGRPVEDCEAAARAVMPAD